MRKLHTAFLNVRSLVPHYSDIKSILLQEKYDILGISETWLSQNIIDNQIQISNYRFIRVDRTTRGGGVGMYFRNDFNYEILNSHQTEYLEQLWIKFKFNNISYIFGTIYRPPRGKFSEFLSQFEDSLAYFSMECEKIVCGGDFNLNLLDLSNRSAQDFVSCIETYNLQQIINTPTRVTATTNSLIDLILIHKDEKYYNCSTKNVPHVTDHMLVSCSFDTKIITENDKYLTVRNLKRIDRDILVTFLENTPFENIVNIRDINDKVLYFNTLLINIFDTLAPVKVIKVKRQKPVWLTDTINTMIDLRDRAFQRYKRTKNQHHWDYYKQLRNQTNIAIRNEKKAYLQFCADDNNSKVLWKRLKNLNIVNKPTVMPLPNFLNKPSDINKHFLHFSTNKQPTDPNLINFYLNNTKINPHIKFEFVAVGTDEVKSQLYSIKSFALGSDLINVEMLWLCCPRILPFLTNIINSCLLEGIFPDAWKIARVMPFPKNNNVNSFNELRPISILPCLSKILEKIMNNQIKVFLEEHSILPPNQSGFRTGYSCATTLLSLTDDIIRSSDSGKSSVLVLLDYSKAFDTIGHDLLLAILNFVGFSSDAIGLIRNYLKNRLQYVETSEGQSSRQLVECGVPQGSILGPVLFTIYTTNFISCLEHVKAYFYADDTQVLYSFSSDDGPAAEVLLNEDLNNLMACSQRHGLLINPDKSSVMIFGRHKDQLRVYLNIRVAGKTIEFAECVKNLGIRIDTDLRFKQQIGYCLQKAYLSLKMLYPHRHLLSETLKIKLTDSLVLSHFNYCDVLYGPCLDKVDINRIDKVQKNCLRFIYGIRKFDPVSHKLKDARWLSMRDRRKIHSLTFFHNIIFNNCPPYLTNKITYRTDVHRLNLRFTGLISPPPHKTTLFKRCFTYNIYKLYNTIPTSMKHLKPAIFKKRVKQMILNNEI